MAVLNGAPEAKKSRISFYTVLYHPERGVFAGPGYLLHSEYAEKVGLPMSGRAFDRMTRAFVKVHHRSRLIDIDTRDGVGPKYNPNEVVAYFRRKHPRYSAVGWGIDEAIACPPVELVPAPR